MRRWFGCIALLLVVSIAIAGDKIVKKREITYRGHQFPNQITILVDASGSMENDNKYGWAVAEARRIAEFASDAGSIRFGAFTTGVTWDPQGRYETPDLDKLKASMIFLSQRIGPDGNTDIPNSVREALAEEIDPLGLIIITDGDPGSNANSDAAKVIAMNEARQSPATIGVVVVKPSLDSEKFGTIVTEKCLGDMVKLTAVKKE